MAAVLAKLAARMLLEMEKSKLDDSQPTYCAAEFQNVASSFCGEVRETRDLLVRLSADELSHPNQTMFKLTSDSMSFDVFIC